MCLEMNIVRDVLANKLVFPFYMWRNGWNVRVQKHRGKSLKVGGPLSSKVHAPCWGSLLLSRLSETV